MISLEVRAGYSGLSLRAVVLDPEYCFKTLTCMQHEYLPLTIIWHGRRDGRLEHAIVIRTCSMVSGRADSRARLGVVAAVARRGGGRFALTSSYFPPPLAKIATRVLLCMTGVGPIVLPICHCGCVGSLKL